MPGFFKSLRIPVLRGRDFTWDDLRPGVASVVVNEAAAKQYWPGQDPLGKRLRRSGDSDAEHTTWFTVVGVVGSVRQTGPRDLPESLLYLPPMLGNDPNRAYTFLLRGPGAAHQGDAIRQAVRAIDPDLPIAAVRTMQEVVDASLVQFTFTMLTLGIAAAVALVLGAVGLYSVLSYAVSLRTREIGVRLALGAPRARVMRSIVVRGIVTAGAGLLVGALGAMALTRLLGSLLFETAPLDPATFAAMAALLLVVALVASYLPARRAASTSPMEAMRGS